MEQPLYERFQCSSATSLGAGVLLFSSVYGLTFFFFPAQLEEKMCLLSDFFFSLPLFSQIKDFSEITLSVTGVYRSELDKREAPIFVVFTTEPANSDVSGDGQL